MQPTQFRPKYALYFVLWLVALIVLLVAYRQFFWLALPGVATYFVKMLNLIDDTDTI